ncbi:MFS transporter [Flavihumibacter petaseus]|uniref:Putative major facilitator superfamily transporter n=1 Tax=Flavihumibacter petaseus NBRC 106054 TaxID=1220578 RepID=A0A0E9N187_9BACT|nr:MFS transporter [Flavihumibacter petaseus]GAO43624.1 putative major facilitator superfamily transporter [Flavihumibacter petaseus NBRC 106054]
MLLRTLTVFRNAYAGLSRETWLLSVIMLINRSGTMVVPFLTLYMTSPGMGYTIGQAGFVFGCFGAGAFAGAYIGGRVTDNIGFFKVQLITLIGGGLLFWILGQMKSLPLICVFTFLLSFVNEAFRPANSTAIAHFSSPENRTRSYSLNRLAVNLGWAVGSAFGGIIAKFSYAWLFWIDGCTNLLAALLMWRFLKAAGRPDEKKQEDIAVDRYRDSAYRDRTYILFILLVTVFAACFFQVFTNVSAYLRNELRFSEPTIGLLMALNGVVIVMIEMVLIYHLEGRKRATWYISIGTALVALFFLFLSIGPVSIFQAALLILLATIGEILAMPFMNSFWISRSKNHNRGQYAALYTMAWSAAQTLGPMLAAQLAQHMGFRFTWLVIGCGAMLAAIAFRVSRQFDR